MTSRSPSLRCAAWEVSCERRPRRQDGAPPRSEEAAAAISGRNAGASVPSASHRSPRASDGTGITSSGAAEGGKDGCVDNLVLLHPQRSQAGASPRFLSRGETVSRKGQPRGLSRVTGNGHARFLGRRAATPLLLPGKATCTAKALRYRVGNRKLLRERARCNTGNSVES